MRVHDRGATGTVYLGRQAALGRLVAIKVLSPELAADETARRRFEREARAAAGITHPNVVTVHQVGTLPDGPPFLVMEHVEGKTLAEHLEAAGTLDVDEAIRVLERVASALEASHRTNTVHRDVRPGNVLYESERGRVVLADFGIAAVLTSGAETVERLTRTGELLGDVEHTSPEQLRGEHPTRETDVYALGVLGYEILTGQGPYAWETPQELISAHLREEPRRLAELRPDVPDALDDLLRRCLAKTPRRRPTAGQLASALEEMAVASAARDPRAAATGTAPARGDERAAGLSGSPRPAREAGGGGGPGASGSGSRLGEVSGLRSLYRELKRRHVVRVAVVYAAVAWVLVQVAVAVFPALKLPDWTITLVVVLAILAFPIALVLAWAFELTPEGMRRTRSRDEERGEAG